MFFCGIDIFNSIISLSCISMANKECNVRPEIIYVNSNESVFYPFRIKASKCSWTNETRHIKCHETCKCKCRLDASVCKNRQRWNNDKCWCEYKELINKGEFNKGYP